MHQLLAPFYIICRDVHLIINRISGTLPGEEFEIDDSLDVFPVHGIRDIVASINNQSTNHAKVAAYGTLIGITSLQVVVG